jgi:hypothetical protein
MAISSRLSRVFSSGQVSSYLTGTSNLNTGSRGSMVFGAYQAGGRRSESPTFRVDFLDYNTDTLIQTFNTLPCSPTKDSTTAIAGFWRPGANSNYRVAGYLTAGGFHPGGNTLFAQKLDYANRTWSIPGSAASQTFRGTTWGTTNPGTAGYTYGGYTSQASVIMAAGIDKLLYSTETASLLSSYFDGNRGLSCGACHNGTTAAYQMGSGLGAAGGYSATTRISKVVYSTDTASTLGATLAGAGRDLAAATQNGTTASYCFSGRGGGTQVDKMAFSNETVSLLSSGHSVDVGNGSLDGGANNNGTAIYHAGGATSGSSNLIDKWSVPSDTRSTLSGISGITNTWDLTTLSNCAS